MGKKNMMAFAAMAGCCWVVGLAFFLGFFMGMVRPEQDRLDRLVERECCIERVDNRPRRCTKEEDCTCPNDCFAADTCDYARREWSMGTRARCRGSGTCCSESSSSSPSSFSSSSKSSKSSSKKSSCSRNGEKCCYMRVGSCYDVFVVFSLCDGGERDGNIYQDAHECGLDSQRCLNDFSNQYSAGNRVTCWYDPKENEVDIEENPSNSKLVGGWVGAGAGIVFFTCGCIFSVIALLLAAKKAAKSMDG